MVQFNSIDGMFSVFKRGMIGIYQHCGEAHLHCYLAEFDFRYNRRTALKASDTERHNDLLSMIGGKRLTYRRIGDANHAYTKSASNHCFAEEEDEGEVLDSFAFSV